MSPPLRRSELLADHEHVLADLFKLLEELSEHLVEVPELYECQMDLPFTPESQEATRSVWPDLLETDVQWLLHDDLPFRGLSSTSPPTGGGGPVKRVLTAGQKLLFPQTWMARKLGR